jgi:hypothetical protein
MRRMSAAVALVLFAALPGCWIEEEETSIGMGEFPSLMAEASCTWIFACCDTVERQTVTTATTQQGCVQQLRQSYQSQFQGAVSERWNGSVARGVVDAVRGSAETCPRSFDPADQIAASELVSFTKQAGDLCQNTWDCSTKFCKSGVCANPLPSGSSCAAGEPCKQGLRCTNGTCSVLQPDGAQCAVGTECISGACGAGKCVVSATYTCDGQ